MDLSTTYLGLRLSGPFMPGASPMADSLDSVKRLEDAGASAIVLRSLFEEQITRDRDGMVYHMEVTEGVTPEALSYFPQPRRFRLRARRVSRARPQGEAGGACPGHRLAERNNVRGLAGLRAADPAGRRRRAGTQRLLPGHRPDDQRRGGRPARVGRVAGREEGRQHPRGRQAVTVLLVARALRERSWTGSGRMASCCSTGSTSPTSTSRRSRRCRRCTCPTPGNCP